MRGLRISPRMSSLGVLPSSPYLSGSGRGSPPGSGRSHTPSSLPASPSSTYAVPVLYVCVCVLSIMV